VSALQARAATIEVADAVKGKIFTRSTQKRGYEKQSTINSEFLILNSELKYRRMEGANIVWQA
jgi:hypothetical protein